MAIWHDLVARGLQWVAGRPPARRAGETLIADTEAGELRVDLYRAPGAGADVPVYLNFADTRFIARDAARDDGFCRALADALGCVVLNVHVGAAPQARFPVAPAQAQAAAWWAMMAGRKHGWAGKRLALGGTGAGANLALGACLDLPARMGVKPLAVAALLPRLDMAAAPGGWRDRVAQAAYLPDRAARLAPLASPVRAETLDGFAPTLIAAGEGDPHRGEGEAFAAMLHAAGRQVHLAPVPGPEAAQAEARAFLARIFAAG
ncbi:alpha/beta hydrolase fold domain-containing protein [Sinisalibacter aestuarii]|uniref:Alpha/beta hydrolase fold-3 domain-containing protein n=1 Tax=Sinisalibacter aestuarii TaxID=2949426 RepID=A0ABQ5LU68_9RHOB|nr:alpha/beta hydrolase fold domain-containing protein [Sinisalibacter aestuarii]GKY88520.1 hypothetical protein STA1M1_23890 [Sinisalibacter aestuarii]